MDWHEVVVHGLWGLAIGNFLRSPSVRHLGCHECRSTKIDGMESDWRRTTQVRFRLRTCFQIDGRGLIRYRRFARKVLKIRNRPDWLLVSLVVVSVIILEVLPIFWGHLFMASRASSYLTSNVVILVSQVGPTFVMPIFHLEISGRCTGLIRLVMWLSAPITLLPAYALRQIKQWRKRGQQPHMDGILPLDELIEFIHLHEKGQGNGGTLEDHVGKAMRDLLKGQISAEASSTHVETGAFQPIQFINSVSSTSVQWCGQDPAVGTEHTSRPTSVLSHGQEESRAIDIETASRPTSIRSHGQEASTAIEDVPVSGLRKRGERSTERYEPVAPMVSMQMSELVKDPTHTSSTFVNDRHVGQGTPNARRKMPLRWRYPLQNLSISVTPRKQRVSMRESYRNERKDSGLVTDSFLL